MLDIFHIIGLGFWGSSFLYFCLAFGTALVCFYYYIVPRSSIRNLRGPPPQSWLLGNVRELETSAVGDCEFRWAQQYGHTYKISGGYGSHTLVTSDPKALQFILQTSSYNVLKTDFTLQRSANLLGESSILTTEGNNHKRHRKAMLPAFGFPETKALVHVFQSKASKLVGQWDSAMKGEPSFETNVHRWLARATLDAIGEAAFGYPFGAMDNSENKLGKTYQDMFVGIAAYPSYTKSAWQNLTALLPMPLVKLTDVSTNAKKWTLATRGISRDVASKLLDEQWSSDATNEEGARDVMSLLVKANATEDERTRLTREEVIDQMGNIILAGHETTSNTLAWSLWELSKNHSIQDKLREEIMMYLQTYTNGTIPASEYDGMEYTTAFIKEVLRMHPIVPKIIRKAGKDLIVPFSQPLVDNSGKVINEALLSKGTRIFVNVVAYNRHPDLWGPDPHVFRPERWLDMKESKIKFGVYGNLGVFAAGIHACIGWRFAVYELQSFLIAMMQSFTFDLPANRPTVRRTFAGVMVPQVVGDDKHVSMPLKITKLKD